MSEGDRQRPVRKAGVREVAALAGVSTQTVSRVINEHPSVRDETRQRVRRAMLELGYRVNNAARTLGTRRTRTLGVIASNAALFGPAAGLVALEAAARAAGRWMTTAYADTSDPASAMEALDHLLSQGVDGVVVVAPRVSTVPMLVDHDPGARIVAYPSDAGVRLQHDAARSLVGHLVELGHRRIARLGGPGDWLEEDARRRGFDSAVRSAGLTAAKRWEGDWSAASGSSVAHEVAIAVRDGEVTAVVVANDQMALGLMAGLVAERVSVPDEVSLVGFDGNPDAEFYRPALTTLRMDIDSDARRCVADALGLGAQAVAIVPPHLVRGESTAPPR